MAWRLAKSLQVLESEVLDLFLNTTVWDLGDPAHQATWSDHNPSECCNVVCAIDVLPDGGMSLRWFADTIVETDPRALKYVIYDREIWFPQTGWQPYFGSNPHTGHVHVSVGVGPDGRSTGPYDDTSPWGLLTEDVKDMAITDADAKKIVNQIFQKFQIRATEDSTAVKLGMHEKNRLIDPDRALMYAWGYPKLNRKLLLEVLANQEAILASQAGTDVVEAVRAELTQFKEGLAAELTEDLGDSLAERLTDVPADQVRAEVTAAVQEALNRTKLVVGQDGEE